MMHLQAQSVAIRRLQNVVHYVGKGTNPNPKTISQRFATAIQVAKRIVKPLGHKGEIVRIARDGKHGSEDGTKLFRLGDTG